MQFTTPSLLIGKFWNCFLRRINRCALAHAAENLRRSLGSAGTNMQLPPDLQVDFAERVQVGDWVYVGPGGQFFGRGGLTISDHVIIGPEVTIMTSMHNYKNAKFVPYDEVELLKPVEIGEACWIGYRVIILPGVKLGKGCIVGAGSVVTKSFPDCTIVAGNPAKIIGTRNFEHFFSCITNEDVYLKNKVSGKLEKVEHVTTSRRNE